jgi:general secretion pathway protein G
MKKRAIELAASRSQNAFTLLEIMLVVIIIGGLVALAIVSISGRGQVAFEETARSMVNGTLSSALEMYHLDNGIYPSTEQGLRALVTKPSGDPPPPNWRQPYLDRVSKDPWKRDYVYKYPGVHNPNKYDVYSIGADGIDGTADDIGNWETTNP